MEWSVELNSMIGLFGQFNVKFVPVQIFFGRFEESLDGFAMRVEAGNC